MNKVDFLINLEIKLKKNKVKDYRSYKEYYSELLDDNIEQGKSVEDSISDMGGFDAIVNAILTDEEIIQETVPLTGIKWLNLTLILVGAPLWAPILLVFLTVIIAFYLFIWCIPLLFSGLCLVSLSLGTISIIGVPFNKEVYYMLSQTGFSFLTLGLGLLFLLFTINTIRNIAKLTTKFTKKILSIFKIK